MTLMRDHEQFWAKVTCPDRLTVAGPPGYDDVVPFARALVEEFPDRVLWGTDWPHPNLRSHMPDDGNLVDFLPRIAETDDARRRLLVANPAQLYWSDQV
jgi:2-pyrone-4,6-dicarboxylate lactonase